MLGSRFLLRTVKLAVCLTLNLSLVACVSPPSLPASVTGVQHFGVSTVAGNGSFGLADGRPGQFYHPSSVVVTPSGDALLLDRYNLRICRISASGETSTFWSSPSRGNAEGGPGVGLFNLPIALLLRSNGDVLIADAQNHTIRQLRDGQLTTFAGSSQGFQDGPAAEAAFNWPGDLAEDAQGNIFVADRDNHAIRKISAGQVTTLAGNGEADYVDGLGRAARFNQPVALTFGPDGNLYVSDAQNNVIRRLTPAGEVTTFAGSGQPGSREDARLRAEFRQPYGLAFGPDGSLFVADRFNHRIRRIATDGLVTSVAGTGQAGYADGSGNQAAFSYPYDLAFDAAGRLLVADYGNHALRRLEPTGNSASSLTSFSADGR